MISILNSILCVLTGMAAYVALGVMTVVNIVLLGIGDLWTTILAGLPDMPTPPTWDGVDAMVFSTVAWMFPVGFLVATLSTMLLLWVAWQGVAALLRWGKWI